LGAQCGTESDSTRVDASGTSQHRLGGPQVFLRRITDHGRRGVDGNGRFFFLLFPMHSREQAPTCLKYLRRRVISDVALALSQIRLLICMAFYPDVFENAANSDRQSPTKGHPGTHYKKKKGHRHHSTSRLRSATHKRNFIRRVILRVCFVFGPLDSSPLARTRHRGLGIFPSSPRAGLRTRTERRSPRVAASSPWRRRSTDPRGNVLLSVNRPRPRGLAPRAGSSARGR